MATPNSQNSTTQLVVNNSTTQLVVNTDPDTIADLYRLVAETGESVAEVLRRGASAHKLMSVEMAKWSILLIQEKWASRPTRRVVFE
jgi:predicted regulator of Ras-like GTPase activity (Roadblock/LC7/MglB family)